MRETQARTYLPQVAPEVADLVETGFLKPNWFDLADGVYTKEFAEKVQTLPRFELSARPLEIPPSLLALPTDSEVLFRQSEFDKVRPAWLLLQAFRDRMDRQAKGYFELSEAAEILSSSITDEWGMRMPIDKMWAEMKDAFLIGALTFYDEYKQPIDLAKLRRINAPCANLYMPDYNLLGMYGETTTPQAINQWLESTGSPHRFPEAVGAPVAPVDEVPAPQASPEPVQAAPARRVLASNLQDAAILAAIREAGYDPLALPKNSPGKPGVKAAIRSALVGRAGTPFPEFGRQFDKSWERLREREEIADA